MIPNIPPDFSISASVLGITSLSAIVCGGLCIYLSCRCIGQRRAIRSTLYAILALLTLSIEAIVIFAALNIHSFQRLTSEVPVAEIRFKQIASQHYRATLHLPASESDREYILRGDEWQLDARVLKWKPPMSLLGIDNWYRLERLQGRFRDIRQARSQLPSVFELHEPAELDIAYLPEKYADYFPWLDARFGSATYLPMADDAHYSVNLGQTGLIARPLNVPARKTLKSW